MLYKNTENIRRANVREKYIVKVSYVRRGYGKPQTDSSIQKPNKVGSIKLSRRQ